MAETKEYLDFAGLTHYDELIKEYLKNHYDSIGKASDALTNAKSYTDEQILNNNLEWKRLGQ